MARFFVHEILTATSGKLQGHSDENTLKAMINGVSTDSRSISSDDVFVALVGQKFDGHHYCQSVFDSGARFFVLSDASYLPAEATGIIVDDTLLALQQLAKYYRKKLSCTVLAVTGSVGKTSTRLMLETAFSSLMNVYATKNNNNNEIGLPLTILSAPEDTQLLILEMGMRLKGEIRELTQIAQPDIAIVTNIGVSHIERLGSKENILEAKMEICEGLGAQGLLIINSDDSMLRDYVIQPEKRTWKSLGTVSFSSCKDVESISDYLVHVERVELFSDRTQFNVCVHCDNKIKKYTCRLSVVGEHHVRNALFSILSAVGMGKKIDKVISALENFSPIDSRGRIFQTKSFTIYDDAYNASPESMSAAFESAKQLSQGRRMVAALGGILELGEYAPKIHEQVGMHAAQVGFDKIFVCGDHKEDFKRGYLSVSQETDIMLFDNKEALTSSLLLEIRKDDIIVIKASNSFGFQSIAQEIVNFDQDNHNVEGADAF